MAYDVTLIPGDGIGPEVTAAARRVIDATGVVVSWEIREAGSDVMEQYGTPLPDVVLESIRKNKVALKGPITTPIGTGFRSVNVSLRKQLGLYACLRPAKWYEGVRSRYENVNLVVVRENMEDLYAGIEFEEGRPETESLIATLNQASGSVIRPDSGISIKPISISGTERIVRFAFEYARANNRKRVAAVTKANIMKFTDGLFLRTARQVAEEYQDVEFQEVLVDNMCMQLVQKPEEYDVLVLPNLYGDIVSDLCAGLVGGLGVAPGANIGADMSLFEPVHGSAPKYAGQNKTNPTATILSGVLMLRHLGEADAADRAERALAEVIKEGVSVTYDLKPDRKGGVGTSEMADAIVEKITATAPSAAPRGVPAH